MRPPILPLMSWRPLLLVLKPRRRLKRQIYYVWKMLMSRMYWGCNVEDNVMQYRDPLLNLTGRKKNLLDMVSSRRSAWAAQQHGGRSCRKDTPRSSFSIKQRSINLRDNLLFSARHILRVKLLSDEPPLMPTDYIFCNLDLFLFFHPRHSHVILCSSPTSCVTDAWWNPDVIWH